MDFTIQREDLRIREMAREFALQALAPCARGADENRHFDRTKVVELGRAGLLGGFLPRALGGSGWSMTQWALALMELGAVDSSWRGFCTVQTALCGGLLWKLGRADQQKSLLPALCAGERIFAFALTEPEAGTDVASLQTRARRDGDEWIIDGTKHWITNGGVAEHIIVFATVDPALGKKGITAFLIPGDAAGLTRRPVEGVELGHRASNHAILQFEGVRVSATAMLGEVGSGFEAGMAGLENGRLGVAAGAVGIQMAGEQACPPFARAREQVGKRIGDFQLIQEALTDMHVGLESTRLLTLRAASLRDQGHEALRELSVAKYAACEAAVKAADQAILLHGARGYSSAFPVERFYRDAKGLQIYEGTAHIQRVIIAKTLLPRTQ